MVELARRKASWPGVRVRFEVGVIEALPFRADHFDVLLSSPMLHHLPEDSKRRGLPEVLRVLKPGGRVVAVDFGAKPSLLGTEPARGPPHGRLKAGLRSGYSLYATE